MSIQTKTANPKVSNDGTSMMTELSKLPEAADQSFVNGSLIYLVGGKVTICGADPALIYGRALADATGVTDTLIPIERFTQRDFIEIQYSDGSDPIASNDAVIGNRYGLVNISGIWYVDTSETVNVRVIHFARDEYVDEDEDTSTWGRVHIIDDYLQSEGS